MSALEWTNCSCVSGRGLVVSGVNRMHLDSSIANPTSPHISSANAGNSRQNKELSQKNIRARGPTGTIARGAHIAPLLVRICFALCTTGV